VVEVRRMTPATVEAVWDVLADGWRYPSWVVGAARMRSVTADWPAVGAKLHHSVGAWPLLRDDVTWVDTVRTGRQLVLCGRILPLGVARIEFVLEPAPGGGCEIVMREDVASGPAQLLPPPVRTALIAPRNRETTKRLAYLAERSSR
jgi:hypothetical protein